MYNGCGDPSRRKTKVTDREYEDRFKAFMKASGIDGDHLSFTRSCHSVAEAADAAGVTPEDFVKSICMIDEKGGLIVAIVKGEDRASASRVARALGRSMVRIATSVEVFDKTGYPCGGTPSFGYAATFLVDPRVTEMEFVYMGGGSETSLVKIRPSEILRANGAAVLRIRR
jgi:Cys-tRNA(Pro)/Cys-tRNA(Cys) deacylase